METRTISLATNGATVVWDFFHLHSSERSSSLTWQKNRPLSRPSFPLFTSQSFSADLHSPALTGLNKHILGVCDPPKDNVNAASICHLYKFVLFHDFRSGCLKIFD